MKRLIKSALHFVAPQWADAYFAVRANAHRERLFADLGLPELQTRVRDRLGSGVCGGLFAGMRYIDDARGSAYIPKLVGSYEAEVAPVIASLPGRGLRLLVDVGCAEGFYAVGTARMLGDGTRVIAYDVDPVSRALCGKMAAANGVADRVEVRSECNHRELRDVLGVPGAFLLCDCEGYEMELLDPAAVPELRAAEVLVELHDAFQPGIQQAICARFAQTHDITLIESRDRDPADYPVLDFLTPEERALALSEYRGGPQTWAHLVPRAA